jgi:hypothetical protein
MPTIVQGKEIVQSVKDSAKEAKSLKSIIDQALGHNSAISINWGSLPAELEAVLTDESVSAADVSNAIGSLAAFQTFWATHGGNLEKFCKPIV